jgi:hypothetical protein
VTAVWSSLIAVIGTLSGGLLAGLVQARLASAARREMRGDTRRADALAAVTALVSAVADHRRARWMREELRLTDASEHPLAEARTACRTTRSAITAPLVTVRILLPALIPAAEHAVQATYAMRDCGDHATLTQLRAEALDASDRLVEAASAFFAAHAVEVTR